MAQSSTQPQAGTALITGASSGIGYEFAVLFARAGYDLVLVARNRAALAALAARVRDEFAVRAEIQSKDLSTPGSAEEVFSFVRDSGLTVDVLINDAGFAMQGPLAQNDTATLLDMLQVNVVSLTHLTRLCLPQMIERGRGRILNMASIGAFMPGPLMAAYFASKAYVLSFSEALANELHGTGVKVTALCPGPTRTRFAARARLLQTKAFRGNLMDAADVAQQGFKALMKGRRVVVAGLKHRLQLLPRPLVPRRVLAHFARLYHETAPWAADQTPAPPAWPTGPDPAAGRIAQP